MKRFVLFAGVLILTIIVMNSCKKDDAPPAPPTFEELLTGGAAATEGKTWVLSKGTYPSDDGGGAVTNEMFALLSIPENIQELLGREYDNEFTFYADGKYAINPVNDTVLAATLSSSLGGIVCEWTQNELGLCGALYPPVTNATWTLHEEDFTVDALLNPLDNTTPPLHGNQTFTGKKWLSFSEGAYFGILDVSTSTHVIIKEVTETEMHVALLVCMYQGVMNEGGLAFAQYPTHIFQLTYVPKAK
jgi:hypothetical protein